MVNHLEAIFRRITEALQQLTYLGWSPKRDIDPFILWSRREYNSPPDHIANAVMDTGRSWEWMDNDMLRRVKCQGGSLKICVDGGWRGPSSAGIAFSAYEAHLDGAGNFSFAPAWLSGQPISCTQSAFQTEAMALDWTLSKIVSFLRE